MDFYNFYTMVTIIAIIILIFALAFIGWTLSKQKTIDEHPKLRTTCPDFWAIDDNGNCVRPIEGGLNRGIGTTENPIDKDAYGFDDGKTKFMSSDPGWGSAGNAVCGKQKWANAHGITWDTVTNANFC
jgi:hypothetical protein